MSDASFAEGAPRAVAVRALDAEDVTVLSALVQDAVTTRGDMAFMARARRFACLLNRYRWEESAAKERARAMLVVEEALSVRSQGVPDDPDMVLSVLAVTWEPGEEPGGRVVLTLAGDGVVEVEVEALDVTLRDVTRPYRAPSRRTPQHPD